MYLVVTVNKRSQYAPWRRHYILVHQVLKPMPSTCAMDRVDAARVLDVDHMLVELRWRVVRQTGKRNLLPQSGE
jgi:hypothetical protein